MMSVNGVGALVGIMVAAYLIQRIFGLKQAQNIRKAYADLYKRRHKSCCVAYGKSKDLLLFKGCLVILAVNTAGHVEEALKLEGRTIFSRMVQAPELVGIDAKGLAQEASSKKGERRDGNDRMPREARLYKRAVADAAGNAMAYMSELAQTAC